MNKSFLSKYTWPQSSLTRIKMSAGKMVIGSQQDKRYHHINSLSSSNKAWPGRLTVIYPPKIDLTKIEIITKQEARPDVCSGCFPHNFNYSILNKNICEVKNNVNVDIFILIFTHHKNSQARNAIRRTWASPHRKKLSNVRYAFLLGKASNDNLNERVTEEASQYHDVLMEDFQESYRNLTYKTIMGLKYASMYCNNAKYVFKTDDDVWVNIPLLIVLLQKRKNQLPDSIVGYCHMYRHPIRTVSKYRIPIRLYPHPLYPMFCSGTGYVMKLKTARDILEISKDIPFFPLEDVFVGMCAKKLGYHVTHWKEFNIIYKWKSRFNPCFLKSSHILTFHHVLDMDVIWRARCNNNIFSQQRWKIPN